MLKIRPAQCTKPKVCMKEGKKWRLWNKARQSVHTAYSPRGTFWLLAHLLGEDHLSGIATLVPGLDLPTVVHQGCLHQDHLGLQDQHSQH